MILNHPDLSRKASYNLFHYEVIWTEDSSIGTLTKSRKVSFRSVKKLSRALAALELEKLLSEKYPFRHYVTIR